MKLVALLHTINEQNTTEAFGGRPVGDPNSQDASGGPEYLTPGGQEGVPTEEPEEEFKPEEFEKEIAKYTEAMPVDDEDLDDERNSYDSSFNVDGVDYNLHTRIRQMHSKSPPTMTIELEGGKGVEDYGMGTKHKINVFDEAMKTVESLITGNQPIEVMLFFIPLGNVGRGLTKRVPNYLPSGYKLWSFRPPVVWTITKEGKKPRTFIEVDHPEYMPDEGPARYDPAYDYPDVAQRHPNFNTGFPNS